MAIPHLAGHKFIDNQGAERGRGYRLEVDRLGSDVKMGETLESLKFAERGLLKFVRFEKFFNNQTAVAGLDVI
jgi:hypothetical protein